MVHSHLFSWHISVVLHNFISCIAGSEAQELVESNSERRRPFLFKKKVSLTPKKIVNLTNNLRDSVNVVLFSFSLTHLLSGNLPLLIITHNDLALVSHQSNVNFCKIMA